MNRFETGPCARRKVGFPLCGTRRGARGRRRTGAPLTRSRGMRGRDTWQSPPARRPPSRATCSRAPSAFPVRAPHLPRQRPRTSARPYKCGRRRWRRRQCNACTSTTTARAQRTLWPAPATSAISAAHSFRHFRRPGKQLTPCCARYRRKTKVCLELGKTRLNSWIGVKLRFIIIVLFVIRPTEGPAKIILTVGCPRFITHTPLLASSPPIFHIFTNGDQTKIKKIFFIFLKALLFFATVFIFFINIYWIFINTV